MNPADPYVSQVLQHLVHAARQQPGSELGITDESGAVIATVRAHSLPKRPKDMPRAMRPRTKLSNRQRAAAKRQRR